MQRRGESGQPVKGQRTRGSKARKAPTAQESTADLQEQLDRRTRERDEALEQVAATSEILGVIRRSPTNTQPVFDAICESASRLCEAMFSMVWRYDGELLHYAASHNFTPEVLDHILKTYPKRPDRSVAAGRAILDGRIVHVPDMLADPGYAHELALAGNWRASIAVPMLCDGKPVGAISVGKAEAEPFSERQMQLLTTFADQAVIAIENVRLFNETREALEQQTATSEVLKVISSSPGELEPVFNTMLENATRICEAQLGVLMMFEAGAFHYVTSHGVTPAYAEAMRRDPVFRPSAGHPLDRLASTKQVIHIPDVRVEQGMRGRLVELAGARTLLSVPMLKDNKLVGTIAIYRQEVRPFTDKQIELVKNFAAQAVIAIENARLLNELRETLERQTATSEVLQVISKSPGELEPVFEAMLENATHICDASYGSMWLREGNTLQNAAFHGALPAAFTEQWRTGMMPQLDSNIPVARAARSRKPLQVADLRDDQAYRDGQPLAVTAADVAGIRTLLGVPMLKNDELVGVIAIYRTEVRPFTDKQVELVKNFAAQAVIAIENTRLLNELRESLQQQTATADVLKVISTSPGELQPVFDTMLAKATELCEASFGTMWLVAHDGYMRTAALHGPLPPKYREHWGVGTLFKPNPLVPSARAIKTHKPVQVTDLREDRSYLDRDPLVVSAVEVSGVRSLISVPMLKENELIGTIAIYRQELRPFTDKQVKLVENFANQAVIAIENARLLNELRTRTNELAQSVSELQALGEVSQAVNSTLELETVLTTIVGRAVELSHTDTGAIYVFDEERREFRLHATYGMSEAMIAAISGQHIGLDDGNVGAATAQRKPVQIADIRDEPTSPVNEIILREGYRSILVIPLLRPDHIVGALVVRRKATGEFPQSTIDLLQTFADQSVVAIQNARLYENVEARTRELAASLDDLRATQDRLVQTQKLASLGQLTAGIAHEIKNPLNFVNNFSGVSAELIDELQDTLKGIPFDDKTRAEINELTNTLRGNLDKVVQHGKRADAIVKNMLLHSREGSGEHRLVDINAIVEESLNLAYHGARAEKQGFNITLQRSFDPLAGEADLFPQEITRALLNFISNGFYAAAKRGTEANGGNYEPTLAASTKNLGDRVEITIRDNGTGIPPEVKAKMFNPFFTTKPAGEGTGLGLSISHDIIVKQHGGSIEVDTQPGEFTEIKIILPRAAVLVAERA